MRRFSEAMSAAATRVRDFADLADFVAFVDLADLVGLAAFAGFAGALRRRLEPLLPDTRRAVNAPSPG